MRIAFATVISAFTCFFLLVTFCSSTSAQEQEQTSLFDMSLEELMKLKVVSVTRIPDQDYFSSAAAIHVITQEDIQSSGHTSLPEQLRMVPGMHVARIDGNKWAIAPRGFNSLFNNKTLVQLDGRTLYSPIFSGVYWGNQDPTLEDLDRIEVIRGPGGSLWGANAFNGIVNIMSKTARETQGWLLSGGAGDEEQGFGTVRYGGQLAENAFFRIYAKHNERDDSATYGDPHSDESRFTQGGFRIDWEETNDNSFTLQGDLFQSRWDDSFIAADLSSGTNPANKMDVENNGWDILGRWCRSFSETSSMKFQVYFDRNDYKDDEDLTSRAQVDVFDMDFQHNLALGERNQAVWGFGYRRVHSHFRRGVAKTMYNPSKRSTQTFSFFVQDAIALIHDRLALTVGTKIEDNDHTGWEIQPNVRLAWTPDAKHTLWAAVSRAVRVPSIIQEDLDLIVLMLAPNTPFTLEGNRHLDSEKMVSLECGFRMRPFETLLLDITAFSNWYDDLTVTRELPVFPPVVQWVNQQDGYSQGIEAAVTWQVSPQWKLSSSYSWMNMRLDGGAAEAMEEDVPSHQFQVRSYYHFTPDLELNSALYYYDRVSKHDTDSFFRLDLGLIWEPVTNFEISVWGQNLLDPKHKEYGTDPFFSAGGGEMQRSFYAKMTWRF